MILICLSAEAGESQSLTPAFPNQPTAAGPISRIFLTGDWWGYRTRLSDSGLDFYTEYTGEYWRNTTGGLRTGSSWLGLLDFGFDLDLGKQFESSSLGIFHAGAIFPHQSESPTNSRVGDLTTLSNIDAPESLRLFETWYQHAFAGDRLFAKAGILAADENFAFSDVAAVFINSTFGWPQHITGNAARTAPAYFATAPGIHLDWQPTEEFQYQLGVYDGDALDSPTGDTTVNESGTHISLSDEQGTFGIVEATWRPVFENRENRYPGVYSIGAWLHTNDMDDLYHDTAGGSAIVSGLPSKTYRENYGVYWSLEQFVLREIWETDPAEDQGLSLFFRGGIAPDDRSPTDYSIDTGITLTGLIPGRDEDILGLGFVYVHVSDSLRRSERDDRNINGTLLPAISDYEALIEVTYQAKLREWWTVQPSLQWIHHPGGSTVLDDALVLGLRASLVF